MHKLSIITINYNNIEGLQKTMRSVSEQTFKDYEYIIIDGGSTDGSAEVILHNSRLLTYFISEPDMGIYNAMNKGILQAKGEYLQFLNSGDWLENESVLSKVFDTPRSAEILYGNMNEVLPNGTIELQVPLIGDKLTMANFNSNTHATVQHPASFIQRSLFDKGLYDEQYRIIADIKFFIDRIILQNCTVEYLPFVITNFNLEGLSSNPVNWAKTIAERERIFSELLPPRILKDYELLFQVKDSPLLKYIPFIEKTSGLKKLVSKGVAFSINIYKLIKNKG